MSAAAAAEALPSTKQEAQQGPPDGSAGETEEQEGSAAAGGLQESIASEQSSSLCAPVSTHHQELQEQPADQQDSQSGDAVLESAEEDSSADHALLDGIDAMLSERSRLQQELSGYLQQLGSREDKEGEPLVLMTEDYGLLVERMMREGRALQYRALQGWEGPHRWACLKLLACWWLAGLHTMMQCTLLQCCHRPLPARTWSAAPVHRNGGNTLLS
jgi:hypothetical protein